MCLSILTVLVKVDASDIVMINHVLTKVLKNANHPSFMTLQDLQGARASPKFKLEWDLLTQKPKRIKKHLILIENSDLLPYASKSSYG